MKMCIPIDILINFRPLSIHNIEIEWHGLSIRGIGGEIGNGS